MGGVDIGVLDVDNHKHKTNPETVIAIEGAKDDLQNIGAKFHKSTSGFGYHGVYRKAIEWPYHSGKLNLDLDTYSDGPKVEMWKSRQYVVWPVEMGENGEVFPRLPEDISLDDELPTIDELILASIPRFSRQLEDHLSKKDVPPFPNDLKYKTNKRGNALRIAKYLHSTGRPIQIIQHEDAPTAYVPDEQGVLHWLAGGAKGVIARLINCLLYTSPSPRDS